MQCKEASVALTTVNLVVSFGCATYHPHLKWFSCKACQVDPFILGIIYLKDNAPSSRSKTFDYIDTICCSIWLSVTLCTAMRQAFLSFPISWSLLRLMYIESMVPSNHLILCRTLILLPSVFPSISVFSSELALCIRWPKYWSFSISPSNEFSGWFPSGLTDLIPLLSKGLSRIFSSATIWKHQFFGAQSRAR